MGQSRRHSTAAISRAAGDMLAKLAAGRESADQTPVNHCALSKLTGETLEMKRLHSALIVCRRTVIVNCKTYCRINTTR